MKQLLKYDITLQWRQGFWLVYFIVSVAFVVILFNIPQTHRLPVTIYILLSDTSILGITFVGALILLEKQQNVLHSLFVTPLSIRNYLISKTTSLTLLITFMCLLILLPVNSPGWHFIPILCATILSSIIFTLLGLGISSQANTINQYLGRMIGFSIFIPVPVIPFIMFDNFKWLIIFPINAALDIMLNVIDGTATALIYIDLIILIFWTFIAYYFAYNEFKKHVLNN
ncbi:hypothetical protein ACFLU5_06355 [Bacteroidota bacterium]